MLFRRFLDLEELKPLRKNILRSMFYVWVGAFYNILSCSRSMMRPYFLSSPYMPQITSNVWLWHSKQKRSFSLPAVLPNTTRRQYGQTLLTMAYCSFLTFTLIHMYQNIFFAGILWCRSYPILSSFWTLSAFYRVFMDFFHLRAF